MEQGYRNNQFGTDLLAQYLELYGYVPPNAYGIPASGGILNQQTAMGQGALSGAAPYLEMNPSANRRSTAPINVPAPPSRQIGTNEMLMRVGGSNDGRCCKGWP